MRKGFLFIVNVVLVLLTLWTPKYMLSQDTIPDDFCLSDDEVQLVHLINDYRKTMAMSAIPLSKALCFVAEKHAVDLDMFKPDTNTCNFHSWSDKGNWEPCCYEKDTKDKSCMVNKPREFTHYSGDAYEIVYWENKKASANKAFNQWRETSASRSLITNFKEWEDKSWNAMGVSIYKSFAIVWFGEETDPENKILVCNTNKFVSISQPKKESSKKLVDQATGRFYVIVGSFQSLEDAQGELNKYVEDGFKKAKVVTKDNKFRISLSDYSTMEQAGTAKKELPEKYKGAWVLEY